MRALLDKHPELQAVTVMRVDWDSHRDAAIVRELGVRRRSTLIAFNAGKEVGRVVADTSERAIEALLRSAI